MNINYQQAVFEKSFATAEQLPPSTLPEICFSGRSNVGKSSLINALLGRKSIARVSGKPGKTVTVNFYRVDRVYFADLPGYGYAKVPFSEKTRWSDLMEAYFRSGREIRMAFQLIDMRHSATAFDLSMLAFLRDAGIPVTVVLTKADKLNKTEYQARLAAAEQELGKAGNGLTIVPFSVENATAVEKLRKIVESVL